MRAFLTMLILATVAQAAPVPKPSAKEQVEAKFGKIVDPKGDTDFKMDGKTLVVMLPGNAVKIIEVDREEEFEKPRKMVGNSPTIEFKEFKGDFEVEFAVTIKLSPKAGGHDGKRVAVFAGAGLLIECKERGGISFGLLNRRDKDDSALSPHILLNCNLVGIGMSSGALIGRGDQKKTPPEGTLKTRQRFGGDGILVEWAVGSERMAPIYESTGEFVTSAPMKLSLVFFHSSDTAHEVRIDDFKITPIVKKK